MIGFNVGDTSQTIDVLIVDDDGLPVTGLVAATFPVLTHSRAGANADASITLVDLALTTTAWASGGVKSRGGGLYRLDLPDAVLALPGRVTIRGEETGKHLIVELLDVGAGLGTGAFAITFTVTDSVSAAPIQSATVTLSRTGETATGTTNASGQVTLYVSAATFTRTVTAGGYSTSGASQVVTAAASVAVALVSAAITPSSASLTTGYVTIRNMAGAIVVGATVQVEVDHLAIGTTGSGLSVRRVSAVTDSAGLAQFAGLPRLAKYRVKVGLGAWTQTAVTLDATTTPLVAPLGPFA